MQPHEIHPSPITGSNGSTTDLQAARIKNQRRISAVLPTISLMVYQPQDFTGSTSKRSKLMGRWIAALPSRPVHNTVQVYQSTRNTRLIRLHSNARPCALPLMMEGCSAIPLGQPSPPQNCCIGRYLYGRLVFFTYAAGASSSLTGRVPCSLR